MQLCGDDYVKVLLVLLFIIIRYSYSNQITLNFIGNRDVGSEIGDLCK